MNHEQGENSLAEYFLKLRTLFTRSGLSDFFYRRMLRNIRKEFEVDQTFDFLDGLDEIKILSSHL